MKAERVLVHVSRTEQRVVDPHDIYVLCARGGETEVRLRSRTPWIDVRPLGEVAPQLEPPVNRVLPVARDRLAELRAALGHGAG